MFKQLILTLTALSMAICIGSASRMNRPYDCSAVMKVEGLEKFPNGECHEIVSLDEDGLDEYKDKLSLEARLDKLETCTCNLLRHELVWKSLISHQVNTVFLATRRLVDQVIAEKSKNLDADTKQPTKELLAELGDEDGQTYYWDNLTNVLNEVVDNKKASIKMAEKFMAAYAEVYYDPETYTKPYNSASMEMQQQVSMTCSKHIQNFDNFLFYFDRLKTISGNDRYVVEIVSYNYDLYRLFIVMKLCYFLDMGGLIGWR